MKRIEMIPRHLSTVVLLVLYGLVPAVLFGKPGLVVTVIGAIMWGIVLVDERSLPAWMEWALPVKGRWARYLLVLCLVMMLLTLPLWVPWVSR